MEIRDNSPFSSDTSKPLPTQTPLRTLKATARITRKEDSALPAEHPTNNSDYDKLYSEHMELRLGYLYKELEAYKAQKGDIPSFQADRAKKLTLLRLSTVGNAG